MRQEHTPTPWEVSSGMIQTVAEHKYTPNSPESFTIPICHMDRKPGNGTSPVERDENAYFIVRAVNSFDAMQAALRRLHHLVSIMRNTDDEIEGLAWEEARIQAENALKLAGEE